MLRTFPLLLALLLPGLVLLPARGALAAAATPAAPVLLPYETAPSAATHPSLYSFADAYRLALSGEAVDGPRDGLRFAPAQAQVRIVSRTTAGASAEPLFSVSVPRDGGRWPLLLAGLFACAWVAHRRLTSPY